MYHASSMGTVTKLDNGSITEQRIRAMIEILRAAPGPLTYEDLQVMTGGEWNEAHTRILGGLSYDIVFYGLATMFVLGMVDRFVEPAGPGRPRINFVWKSDEANLAEVGHLRVASG